MSKRSNEAPFMTQRSYACARSAALKNRRGREILEIYPHLQRFFPSPLDDADRHTALFPQCKRNLISLSNALNLILQRESRRAGLSLTILARLSLTFLDMLMQVATNYWPARYLRKQPTGRQLSLKFPGLGEKALSVSDNNQGAYQKEHEEEQEREQERSVYVSHKMYTNLQAAAPFIIFLCVRIDNTNTS